MLWQSGQAGRQQDAGRREKAHTHSQSGTRRVCAGGPHAVAASLPGCSACGDRERETETETEREYVAIRERQRETEGDRERQRQRETERETDREETSQGERKEGLA